MLKKTMLLAAAVAALAVLAAPVSASAEGWTMEGLPLETEESFETRGPIALSGGFECKKTSATLNLIPGTEGVVTAFGPIGTAAEAECKTTGTYAALCSTITSVESKKFPWLAKWTTDRIDVTIGEIVLKLSGGAFCPSTIKLSAGSEPVKAAVAEAEMTAVKQATLEGKVETSLGGETVVSGLQVVQGTASGTYGL